jgi:hypothetical protein
MDEIGLSLEDMGMGKGNDTSKCVIQHQQNRSKKVVTSSFGPPLQKFGFVPFVKSVLQFAIRVSLLEIFDSRLSSSMGLFGHHERKYTCCNFGIAKVTTSLGCLRVTPLTTGWRWFW